MKNETITQAIDKTMVEAVSFIMEEFKNISLQAVFYRFLVLLTFKIYKHAKTSDLAEFMINSAIKCAKEIYHEKPSRDADEAFEKEVSLKGKKFI